ncbi:MAG: alpha/beta fold hydrolase [Acidobacteria bacterium]|nr:alpha/beta fold hydrolase [Acidobacteriota bacterium]
MSIETIDDLRGPEGHLEALINRGSESAHFAAVLCHPHPPSGGTMHTKAVFHAMKALNAFGIPVLRFNFRGTGKSAGAYSGALGEVEDARAAIEYMSARYALPLIVGGFSFGANMALRAACGDERVRGLIGLGTPIEAEGRRYSYEFLKNCTQPKLFVTGTEDPFAPRDVMENVLRDGPVETKLIWIEGADHFFQGTASSSAPKLDAMRAAIGAWVTEVFGLQK